MEKLLKELDYWENFSPNNNIGKWARDVKIKAIKEQIKSLEDVKIKKEEGSQSENPKKKSKN